MCYLDQNFDQKSFIMKIYEILVIKTHLSPENVSANLKTVSIHTVELTKPNTPQK